MTSSRQRLEQGSRNRLKVFNLFHFQHDLLIIQEAQYEVNLQVNCKVNEENINKLVLGHSPKQEEEYSYV